eukprot:CAMPEP_0202726070 /NCGR_PEP_ID=MMETSP1385-20130828/184423_1 /ASSEMBLY_ACC=CAM_ASM_000861 /TAXON_ID=933848 /ORGANISM="Elphidium margaritaceum" /LENGTH=1239 /DNA_ID=CAMNT_0049392283 /DNA_START=36 /DNA_END=3755 /DNA_ORIENTATION=+
MSSIDVNALQSLLPQAVIQFALKHHDAQPPLKQPFHTVALFADVSGFTKLSEAFASKGPQGAEELAFFLNRYMEQLVRHIARAGGDVFKFAGDAMLVLWVPPEGLDEDGIKKEIRTMAHRAVQASIAIQNELHSAEITDGVTLSVKIGIGVGNATVLHVGGVYARVEYFACGIPLMQAFKSEEKATQGDIIVSPDVWDCVKDSFDGDILDEDYVRITKQTQTIRNRSVKAGGNKVMSGDVHDFQPLLEKYIPAAVLPYLTRCQNSWSGELRLVTVLFVNVGVNLSNVQTIDETSLSWIQTVIQCIQRSIYRYEGSLNKFLVDDKGSNVIAVFGVPPLAHNDDATRGLLAALKLLRKMRGLGVKCFIGVTSGLVYTGLLGSGTSREYGVLGDAVNLAARLMYKQKSDFKVPGVICDTTTQELIPSDAPIRFDPLAPFLVKGKANLIHAFAPKYSEQVMGYQPQSHYYDIGREAYLSVVEKALIKESSFVLLVESVIGSGKTYFLESIVNAINKYVAMKPAATTCSADASIASSPASSSGPAAAMSITVLADTTGEVAAPQPMRRRVIWANAHHYTQSDNIDIWLSIFGDLLQRNTFTENRSYRQHVKSLFMSHGHAELAPYLSLVNDLFGTQFLETEKCSALLEEHRWDKKTECCLAMLQYFSAREMLIIFIDNLQWSVTADWKITEFVVNMTNSAASNALDNIFLMLAAQPLLSALFRPRFVEPPSQYRRIRELLQSRKQLMLLHNWDLVHVKRFMCEYFAVDDAHPCLSHFVYERSGGNPAFVEWICELIDVHVTHSDDVLLLEMSDKTEASITSEAPLQHPVPIKVHSVLMGYIDRLTPSQALSLKTAAAVCMGQGSGSIVFDYQSVMDCYPVSEYRELVASDLQRLAELGIIRIIRHNQVNYDVVSSDPHFFVHNHQWMHSSTFLSCILEVSVNKKAASVKDKNALSSSPGLMLNDDGAIEKRYIFSQKLLHFFVNRLVFYPFNPEKGVSWRLRQTIPFNDPLKPIRMKRVSKEILVVENQQLLVQIKSKPERIDDLHRTFDDALSSRGIMTAQQERESTYPLVGLLRSSTNKEGNSLYCFACGFFRDVVYGLMLLKQRQQLHDNAAKFLGQRWSYSDDPSEEEEEEEESKQNQASSGSNSQRSRSQTSSPSTVNLRTQQRPDVSAFAQVFRSNVLANNDNNCMTMQRSFWGNVGRIRMIRLKKRKKKKKVNKIKQVQAAIVNGRGHRHRRRVLSI